MRKAILILLAVVGLGAIGCGGHVQYAPKEYDTSRKVFGIPPEGHGTIYIFRDGFLGREVNTTLYIDGMILGKNLGNTYLCVDVPEGKHKITSYFTGYTTIEIDVKQGGLYFIRDSVDTQFTRTDTILTPVGEKEGKTAVKKCYLVESAM